MSALKEKWKKLNLITLKIIAVVFIISFIPALLYLFFKKQATLGEWLGFFGTYFGSAISIGFAYINTKYQLKKAKDKDVIDDLHNLLRSTETVLNYLDDLNQTIVQFSGTVDSANNLGFNGNYQEMFQIISKKFSNVVAQTSNFKIDFCSLMDRLEKSETEKIEPKFEKWYGWYHVIYINKSLVYMEITKSDNNESEGYIPEFIKLTKELKLSIEEVYKKRMETYIN